MFSVSVLVAISLWVAAELRRFKISTFTFDLSEWKCTVSYRRERGRILSAHVNFPMTFHSSFTAHITSYHSLIWSDTVGWLTCRDPVKSSPTTNQHTKHLQVQCPCCLPTNCVRALCLLIELCEINHDVITFIHLLILHSVIFTLFLLLSIFMLCCFFNCFCFFSLIIYIFIYFSYYTLSVF